MSAPKEIRFLSTVKRGKRLIKLIHSLRDQRRVNKVAGAKRARLTKKQREALLAKTDGRCHVCGTELDKNKFHADHVKSHITGGLHAENNYLPSCSTCNNLRWHYSSEEIQLIMKLGRWLKAKIVKDEVNGISLADEFIQHEMKLRARRSIE